MIKKIGLAALVAVCVLALGEGAASLTDLEHDKPPPSFGTNHWLFEKKWRGLREEVQQTGSMDCFLVGSSIVEGGINPRIIGRAIGQDVNCYDMSVYGATASEVGIISELIVEYYEPSLIIYGLGARDLNEAFGQSAHASMIDVPWMQYRLGNPSLTGWLGHHSEAYGQIMGLVSWYKLLSMGWQHSHPELIDSVAEVERPFLDFEFEPELVHLSTLETSEADIAGLDQLMALRDRGVTVILVEMPVHEDAWETIFKGYDNYAEGFLQVMDTYAEANDVVFIHSTDFPQGYDWVDWEHMGEPGRTLFSEWLGQQIADGIAEGEITIQTHQHAAD